MVELADLTKRVDELSNSDREKLLTYLIDRLPSPDVPLDDEELDRRDREMELGEVECLDHDEFVRRARR